MSRSTLHIENPPSDIVTPGLRRAFLNAERRPTLPVLVGSFGQCWSTWRCVAESNGLPHGLLRPTDSTDLFRVWLKHLASATDLAEAAILALCRNTELNSESLRRQLPTMGRTRCRQLLQQSEFAAMPATYAVMNAILDAARNGRTVSAQELLETVGQTVPDGDDVTTTVIRAVINITGEKSVPAILCCGAFPSDIVDDGPQTASWRKTIIDLSVAVPTVRLGLTATADAYEAFSADAPDSFWKAVTHDHVIRLCETSTDVIRKQIKTTFISHAAAQQRLDVDTVDNISQLLSEQSNHDQLAEAAIDLVMLQSADNSPADLSEARSRAEAFLFSLLDQRMETAGLFKLNQQMEFNFGSRPAELDLSCIDLKIAIEVDGYFHLQNNDGYRRDRRKDILLQQHGFVVMRFLAEDVVPQMCEIVDAIIRTVQWRRAQFHMTTEAALISQTRKPK